GYNLRQGVAEWIDADSLMSPKPEYILYPNPTDDECILEGHFAGEMLTIYNSLGVLVAEDRLVEGLTKYQFSTRDFPSGIYYCKISEGKNTLKTLKLIIIH
ncbi:MAG: T9SS type A sorting domain-containing protein, partial [Bacteroidia bacterium]|nr:T9SS type A sorting domain-containing protein [Bacteroidia bacterium]